MGSPESSYSTASFPSSVSYNSGSRLVLDERKCNNITLTELWGIVLSYKMPFVREFFLSAATNGCLSVCKRQNSKLVVHLPVSRTFSPVVYRLLYY